MNSHQSEWFVVRTKSRKEALAVHSLARRDVTAFCPWIQEPVGMTNEWATVPLFPGYVFVHITLLSGYYSVIWTPGVKGFVAFGTLPTALKPEVVNFLQQEAGPDGVIRPASRFRSGERVQIKRGPFAGLIGIIEMPCPERGRIRVLMDFLRDGAAVELPLAAVGRL